MALMELLLYEKLIQKKLLNLLKLLIKAKKKYYRPYKCH